MARADDLLAYARLQATERGHGVLVARAARVQLREDALVLAALRMPGEEHIWACAVANRGQTPEIFSAGDARNADDRTQRVIEPLALRLEAQYAACEAAGHAPQVLVSSPAINELLIPAARRRGAEDARVDALGLAAHFLTESLGFAGQQVLLAMTEVLTEHMVSPLSPVEEAHLGALLAALAPPPGESWDVAAAREELTPAGTATDPEIDERAMDLLTELAELRRGGGSEAQQDAKVIAIGDLLRPQVVRVFELIERAADLFERQGLPPLPGIADLQAEDLSRFTFARSRAFVPRRYSVKENAQRLAGREAAADRHTGILLADPVVQELSRQAGDILEGTIIDWVQGGQARSIAEITLRSDQAVSRLRPGDTLKIIETTITLQLLEAGPPDPVSGEYELQFLVASGKTKVAPFVGGAVRLVPSGSFYDGSARRLRDAHAAGSWILRRDGGMPAPLHVAPTTDPFDELAALR